MKNKIMSNNKCTMLGVEGYHINYNTIKIIMFLCKMDHFLILFIKIWNILNNHKNYNNNRFYLQKII
jgi:hypothetical protein